MSWADATAPVFITVIPGAHILTLDDRFLAHTSLSLGGQVGAAPVRIFDTYVRFPNVVSKLTFLDCHAQLKTFPPQTGTSLTWNVDIAAGTSV